MLSAEAIVFKALSDDIRGEILEMLEDEEKSVGQICRLFARVSQPTISHHLQILRRSSLVRSRKEGKMVFYSLDKRALRRVMKDFLERFED